MLTQENAPVSHAGEDRSSVAPEFAGRLAHHQRTMAGINAARLDADHDPVIAQAWSVKLPVIDNAPLTPLILQQKHKVLAGDVVYVTEVRRHVITDGDLNVAARVEIGAAS